ncbi:MAG: YfhO family protein [Candidatus Levybacteria bacterium]|nr:YfhO family protein [Candidatus Levybacteria bacterium]
MKIKYLLSPLLLFVAVTVLFFYKFFFLGLIPMPADLLISENNPWKEYSYLGYLPGTYPSKFQYGDVTHQIYPWKTFAIESLKQGQIPLWNPYSFSGHPFLADIQAGVFQPLNLLYFIFSQAQAWAISIVFQPLLALIGTYLYTRKIGLKKTAAIFSSVSFSFCLFMSTFLEYNTIGHILSYLPITLYSIELLTKRVNILGILLFALSISLTIFAGHIQLAGFNLIFIFLYILFKLKDSKEKVKRAILFLILLVFSVGITALQLLPTIELIGLSARIPQNYTFLIEKLLIQPFQVIVFLSPDFFGNPVTKNYMVLDSYPGNSLYIGIAPLILAVTSILYFKKNKFISFFTVSSFVLLLLFFRTPLSELFYKLNIPFFSTGSPTNAIYLLSFSLSVLAGFGIERLETKNLKRILLVSLLFFVFILINMFLLKDISYLRNALLSLSLLFVITIVFLSGFLKRFKGKFLAPLLIIITVFDLFFFFQKFNPFVAKNLIFPETKIFSYIQKNIGINRLWGYPSASIEPNFTTQFKIQSPEGTDPLYPKWYGEFIQSADTGKIGRGFTNQTRSDAIISPRLNIDLSENTTRSRLLEMLGTRFILDKQKSGTSLKDFPLDRYSISYEDDIWRIFEDKKTADRAFFAEKVSFYSGKDDFEKKFFDPRFNPTNEILLESGSISKDLVVGIGKPSVLKLINYSPNKVTFNTESTNKQILFLSDTYYPGWQADIDGVKTDIVKANYAFRAIAVPKGSHTVSFTYLPFSFTSGLFVSLASLAAVFILCILSLKKKYLE